MTAFWVGWRRGCRRVQWGSSALLFALAALWWLPRWTRPDIWPTDERFFFLRFGYTPLLVVALAAWLAGGLPGLGRLADSANIFWLMLLTQAALWGRLSYGAAVLNADVALGAATAWLVVVAFAASLLCHAPPLRWLAIGVVAGMLGLSLLGIAQVALQHETGIFEADQAAGVNLRFRELDLDPARSGVSIVQAEGVRFLRPYGLTAHPNLLGGALSFGLLASLSLWGGRGQRIAPALVVIGGWALLLTFSRAAWGGLLVGGLFWVGMSVIAAAARRPSHDRDEGGRHTKHLYTAIFSRKNIPSPLAATLTLALLAGLTFLLFYNDLLFVRIGAGEEGGASVEAMSVASRAVYQEQAFDLIAAHPWRGVGMGNFGWHSARMLAAQSAIDLPGDHVHNIYLLIAAELGGIGLGLVLGAWALAFGLAFKRARHLSPEAIGLLAGCIAWLAAGWFDHYPWTQFGYQVVLWGSLAAVLHESAPLSQTREQA